MDIVWDHPTGKCPKAPQGTQWHQFMQRALSNWRSIWLETGATSNILQVTPRESCSSLEEAVGFQSFVSASKWKLLLAQLVKIENLFTEKNKWINTGFPTSREVSWLVKPHTLKNVMFPNYASHSSLQRERHVYFAWPPLLQTPAPSPCPRSPTDLPVQLERSSLGPSCVWAILS